MSLLTGVFAYTHFKLQEQSLKKKEEEKVQPTDVESVAEAEDKMESANGVK